MLRKSCASHFFNGKMNGVCSGICTIKVRLKPITEIVLRKEYTFQFHKGTIKTIIGERGKAA